MHTLNHILEKNLLQADGRYLTPQELHPLEQYLQSYANRLETYQQLGRQSDKLVLQALRQLSQSHPDLIQKHGQRCKYDMTEVLRYIALSILRDDETFFKEQMLSWLDTVLLAFHRSNHCVNAYRYLHDAINNSLPTNCANLIRPYFDIIITALQSHA
jgi:hypothetical protein